MIKAIVLILILLIMVVNEIPIYPLNVYNVV